MNTLKLKPMKFGPLLDWRSLGLCFSYYLLKWSSSSLASIDFKVALEILGAITGVSTVTFNVFKSVNEITKAWTSYKWRRKRKADKKQAEIEKVPFEEPTPPEIDQFD